MDDTNTSSKWKDIVSSSAIFLGLKFLFGSLSNILLFNLFSASTIVLISQISLMQKLPTLFSFGMKHKVHDVVIGGGSEKSAYSNFITTRVFSYIMATVIIALLYGASDVFDLTLPSLILSLFLVGLVILNDVLLSLCFTRGRISLLIHLTSLKTVFFPVVFYLFAESYQIYAWLIGTITLEILQSLILLRLMHNQQKIEFSFNDVSIDRILDFFRRSYVYYGNKSLDLIFELFLFFYFILTMELFEAALLSWLIRMSHTFANFIGSTIQKKFFFDLIELVSHSKLNDAGKARIAKSIQIYDLLVLFILLPITIFYAIVTFLFIDKFADYWFCLPLCFVLTLVRLKGVIYLRMLLTMDAHKSILNVSISSLIVMLSAVLMTLSFGDTALNVFLIVLFTFFSRTIINYVSLTAYTRSTIALAPMVSTCLYTGSLTALIVLMFVTDLSQYAQIALYAAVLLFTLFYMLYVIYEAREFVTQTVRTHLKI